MKVEVDAYAWFHKADLSGVQIDALRREMTIIPTKAEQFDDGEEPKPIFLYQDDGERIGIAREYFLQRRRNDHIVTFNVSKGSPDWHPAPFNYDDWTLRTEQKQGVDEALARFGAGQHGGILRAVPGWGKCLGLGTPVLRFDGSIVPVEEIRVGDKLMGPDSKPRAITSTTTGRGPLYRISPKSGDSWVCNDAHILTLVHSLTGEVMDIEIGDYLRMSAGKKHHLKQFSPAEGVDFHNDGERLVDPYFLGLWYGDGTKSLNGVAISKPDAEVLATCQSIAAVYGLRVRTDGADLGCPTHHLVGDGGPNRLLEQLRKTVGDGDRFPHQYLTAPTGVRRMFLAGFLDADGHNNNGCLRVVQKRRGYAEGVAFLARSLGIRATIRRKVVNGNDYWRVNMAGDFSQLPMRISRKWPGERQQKKVATRTGFSVESVGEGDYAGFTLDGDGRFLLGDFTVTHNTVVGCNIMAQLNVPTLVVVHKEFLVNQWYERITGTGDADLPPLLPEAKVGRCQQDVCDFRGKTVVIGMVHSLGAIRYPDEFYEWPGLVIFDEVHRVGAYTWAPVPAKFPSRYRLGLSATPRRKDGAMNVFFYHIGPILFSAKEKRLKPKLKRIWTKFKLPKTDSFNPNLASKPIVLRFLCASVFRNRVIVEAMIEALRADRKLIVLSERLNHLDALNALLAEMWPAQFGAVPTTGFYVGGRNKDQLRIAARARVIFATWQFASEGLDIPALDTLFMATPMSDVEQACGRILRPHEGKKDPVIVDIRDDNVSMFKKMGQKREKYYDRIC